MRLKNLCLTLAAILFGFLAVTSCSKEDDKPTTTTEQQIETNLQSGSWKITKFIDSGNDESYHFAGYDFSFMSDGVLKATNGTNSYEGSWSISDSNSNDDSEDDLHFNISFPLTNEFEDLNDDWDIISQTDNKIELIDVSGGNGGTDYLTFEKN